jgi:hypothetical protein
MAGVERSVPERMGTRRSSHERRPEDPLPGHERHRSWSGEPSGRIDALLLEEAGAGAFCLAFEEQIEHDQMEAYRFYEDPANSFGEASPIPEVENQLPGRDLLAAYQAAKAALTIPVIASLNGTTREAGPVMPG